MLSCRGHGRNTIKQWIRPGLSGHRPYSSKVRAFPFVVSPEKAAEELSWNTAMFTGDKLFGTWIRRQFGLNVQTLRPSRVQPVYLPTWIIDAEVTANMWFKKQPDDSDTKNETAHVQFTHSTMPGYIFPPLSVKNLVPPHMLGVDPVPWSEELRKNSGEDVLCLPFSVTPFPLIEAVRSISLADSNIGNVLRFEPSSVENSMMAAYPVLLPVYIAQFNVNTVVNGEITQVTATAFMEASYNSENPRIMVEVTQGVIDFFKLFDLPVPDIIIRGQHTNSMRQFAVVRGLLASHATLNHKRRLERWIDQAGASLDNLPLYRERYFGKTEQEAARAVNWNDIRIRPFTREEREANWQYMTAGEELFFVKQLARAHARKREIVASAAQGDPASTAPLDPAEAESLQNHAAAAEKRREEKKPEWLAQYEIQQRLSAGTPEVAATSSVADESNTGGKSSIGDTSSTAGVEP
ncbi:hypothetical protein LXA43DRAFT_984722 [Ganoderma leucocontextum]|nr:hypothetical protein LXA43DRAFT_984722 [Ganoderma leucocontextum]